jgi:hypothetical protein
MKFNSIGAFKLIMKILVVVGNDEQREVCKGNNLNF